MGEPALMIWKLVIGLPDVVNLFFPFIAFHALPQ